MAEDREMTRICPDCGADGDKDEKHADSCQRGKGWKHAVKPDEEQG